MASLKLKSLLKEPLTQFILSHMLAFYIRLVMLTAKKEFYIHPEAKIFMDGKKNAIFAFWHGRMMLLPAVNPQRKMHVLISDHSDGRLISQVIKRFGQDTVKGSSSKGGTEAVRDIIRLLKNGDNVSITPDGPRGPNQTAAMGIVTIAKLSKLPIIPVTFYATKHKRLRSWDKFMLAKIFSRIYFCIGQPIDIKIANEEGRILVEKAMNELTKKASTLGGTEKNADKL
ncbi:MAG: lysophospholipid acyltransferase family protein [Rickettsiales bacterium]